MCDTAGKVTPSLGWFGFSCLSVAALTIPCFFADTQGSTAPAPKALRIKRQMGTQLKKEEKVRREKQGWWNGKWSLSSPLCH